jgi:hypothetical protein
MIRIEGGKARSVLTMLERKGLLAEDLENLTKEEWELLSYIVGEYAETLVGEYDYEQGIKPPTPILSLIEEQEFDKEIVDMETFLFDDYFMGRIGQYLWPKWADDLIELFDPSSKYHEVILSGAIGIGKNYIASIIIARMIYELSCMKNPQRSYGLDPDEEISFSNVSVTKDLAKEAVLGKIKARMTPCPYFTKEFPIKPTKDKIRFPKGIVLVAHATTEESILSLNTFGGIFDEINFLEKRNEAISLRRGKMKAERRGGPQEYSSVLYTALIRRMKSRWMVGGRLPGKLVIVSSKNMQDSFTERKIFDSMDDPHVFTREYAIWEIKPEGSYGRKRFHVFVGNDRHHNRILKDEKEYERYKEFIDSDDAEFEGCDIIHPPVEFKKDFDDNLDGSLQAIAGVAVYSFSPFIYRSEKIHDAIVDDLLHPMLQEEWVPNRPPHVFWDKLVRSYESMDRFGIKETYVAPIINPTAPRYVHVDTSLTSDSSGVCMGHIAGEAKVARRDNEGKVHFEHAPIMYIDFMLKINPPLGEEIILADIRTLLYSFMDRGYRIELVTTDKYQSAEMRQYMRRKGVDAEILSIDTSVDPYMNLRMALYENRLKMYKYDPFLREISRLIHDRHRNKIDHVKNESKDVSDAMAGVVHSLSTIEPHATMLPSLGISDYDDETASRDWIKEELTTKPEPDQEDPRDYIFQILGN